MQAEIAELQAQVRDVQEKLGAIQKLLMEKVQIENKLGDWVDEDSAMALCKMGRTRLYQLRVEGKILSSTLGGKAVFYSVKNLRELLNSNSKNR
jgi:hypothetical protein